MNILSSFTHVVLHLVANLYDFLSCADWTRINHWNYQAQVMKKDCSMTTHLFYLYSIYYSFSQLLWLNSRIIFFSRNNKFRSLNN